jgi:hypothetical protein
MLCLSSLCCALISLWLAGGGVRNAREVQALGDRRVGDGFPVHGQWPVGAQLLQGGRVLHHKHREKQESLPGVVRHPSCYRTMYR